MYVSDTKVLIQLIPQFKLNLSRLQKEKLNFFSHIFEDENDWNNEINYLYGCLISVTRIKGLNKSKFMRLMHPNSIFEHFAYCCQEKYKYQFTSQCQLCRVDVLFKANETFTLCLTESEITELQLHFHCENFKNEFESGYDFIDPMLSNDTDRHKKARFRSVVCCDELIRYYCRTAVSLFISFFLDKSVFRVWKNYFKCQIFTQIYFTC